MSWVSNITVFDSSFELYKRLRVMQGNWPALDPSHRASGGSRADYMPRANDFLGDFATVGARALLGRQLLMFVLLYVNVFEPEAVRTALGVNPDTFADWQDAIRTRAGKAFRKAGLWPQKRYFRVHSDSMAAHLAAGVCE